MASDRRQERALAPLGPKSGKGDRSGGNPATWQPLMPRVFARVNVDRETECWIWTGPTVSNGGYGRLTYRGTSWLVHRATYTELRGVIPDGLTIDHTCQNRRCCNPYHMEVVTQAENLRRGGSFVGLNARKTHCTHGHEYTAETTAWMRDRTCARGWARVCAVCHPGRAKNGVGLEPPEDHQLTMGEAS